MTKDQEAIVGKKDEIIDLMAEDMLKEKCYFSNRTLLKKHYERKVKEC